MTDNYDNFLERLSSAPSWSAENEAALLEPFSYLTATSGKEIRKKLIHGFNFWLKLPEETVVVISRVVSMLHSASLMVDDVEDGSQLRRGQPVAHKIYGIPQTINSANYVYFLAYKELFALRDERGCVANEDEELDRLVTDELLNLHRGQGLDLLWRDSLTCPTEDEYISMVNNKTGGLFRVAIKLMMAKSSSRVDYVPLVNLFSVYFQIRDDYMNLQSSDYESNKGFAEDLTEGKFSFPVVHAIRADTSNRRVLSAYGPGLHLRLVTTWTVDVLQKRPSTPTTKQYVVDYMRDHTNSFVYTLQVLHKLECQAREEIERLGGNPQLSAILDSLSVNTFLK